MGRDGDPHGAAEFEIENVGGISRTSATLEPGVTVLAGENATNRTSFLQAVMAVCGSESASLKADASEGRVELTLGQEQYTRTLTREDGAVSFAGDPYLDDPAVADLFAFLLENNEARRAVARGDGLREHIMRPVDTAQIEREIRDVEDERDQIDAELDRLEALDEKLPDLTRQKRELTDEIDATEAELASKREAIDAQDAGVEETRETKEAHEAKLDELSEARQERREVKQRIAAESESVESLRAERSELEDELADTEAAPEDRIEEIEQEIQRLRGQIQQIDSTVGELQSVIQFNEEFIENGREDVVGPLHWTESDEDEPVTDALVAERDAVTCWTCGSDVEVDQIAATLEQLRSFRNEKMGERQSLETKIADHQAEKSTLEQRKNAVAQTREQLSTVETELEERESRLETLRERRTELEAEIEALDEEVEALETAEHSTVLDAHKEANRLQFELEQLRSDRQEIESEIEAIESELDRRSRLEARREECSEKLARLRTRVEDLETDAIDAFNEHMDSVLERLEYENIERIWVEATSDDIREGRQTVTKDRFELHIVRSNESGEVFEDTVDHLSESEREVTGLVFALAGYLVHEVYESVPFMVLDSIEAIDAARIAKLVEYLEQYADFLVVALLKEDAQALNSSYPRISSI